MYVGKSGFSISILSTMFVAFVIFFVFYS